MFSVSLKYILHNSIPALNLYVSVCHSAIIQEIIFKTSLLMYPEITYRF